MSEMRRAAASLVARRSERFESRHALDESQSRLEAALARARVPRPWPFNAAWTEREGVASLEVTYEPSPRAQRFLEAASLGFVALFGASAWVLVKTDEGALRFLLPMITILAILAFPFVALALASHRDAAEARIRKAIRVALLDEDEKPPPPQRWPDEEP